ncbi:MAG: Bifunctional protein Aas [Phycisphaerae bacterium]|nr:Bifunctional protein Aas [Phycisphaerae bacterium]
MMAIVRSVARRLLALRYDVRIRGLEAVAARGRRGILFLPNHPAFIDPVILVAHLHATFRPRPLIDRDQMQRGYLRWLARQVNALDVPFLGKYGPEARAEVDEAVRRCVEVLRQGQNLLLYPSGHVYRTRLEDLRGNSAAETILSQVSDARVVLVRTRGLWGSSFSYAAGTPDVAHCLRRGALQLLENGLFFSPRRVVEIELEEPSDLPRTAGRNAFNDYLERFYNQDAPAARYVPYSIWESPQTRELPEPRIARPIGDPHEAPPATRALVLQYLSALAGRTNLRDELRLAHDLGLDSLDRAELLLWLGKEFGFHAGDTAALQTVGDCVLAACGQVVGPSAVEIKPAPPAWFRPRPHGAAALPAGESLTSVFLAAARRQPSAVVIADQASGVRTYRDLVTAALVLRPHLARLEGQRVGIMLPASVAATTTYLATLFAGKTPVMVNWTTGARNLQHALDVLDVRRVLTAGALLTRLASQGIDLTGVAERLVRLEELGKRLTRLEKLRAAAAARLSWRALRRAAAPNVAAILLTSGSESLPKAVPLTHANLLANLRDVLSEISIDADERLIGFLPPFHSFGLTVTMLLPLLAGVRAVYHANPTDSFALAGLIEAYRASLVVGTPTFLSGIVRASAPGQLASLRLAVTGAEKCPDKTYAALAAACPQAVVLEGYGITECSPIVSVNRLHEAQPGTIGKLLPSLEAAIVEPERGGRVAPAAVGMLLVRGPSVFGGYLGDAPSPFVEFEGKSWYRTGDLVSADAGGVMTFRGRLKRFVKLGGEMVSLPAIEAVLEQQLARDDDEGPVLAIEATSDEMRPEIVLFTTRDVDRDRANAMIRSAGLSPLHNVSRVVQLDQLPLLGTGKTDYRALHERLGGAPR